MDQSLKADVGWLGRHGRAWGGVLAGTWMGWQGIWVEWGTGMMDESGRAGVEGWECVRREGRVRRRGAME
jgi:hypothetical protein